MSNPINKVLYNVDQRGETTAEEKAQARANIGVEALPVKTGNAGKVLAVNSTATGLEWVAGGGGSQVQANWTETDSSDPSFIQNKPTLATVATTGRYSDLTGKPTIPAEQVNSDWTAQFGKAQILNKPLTMPNATGGLRKTLDADDITNGYIEFKIGTGGSYTGAQSFTNPAFVLFGKLWNLQYNGGAADNYIDTAEVGLYSDGIGAEYIKYYENSHAELVADNAKGWGVSGWWSLTKDKYLSVYVRLVLTSSAATGDEVFCHFTSGIFGTGLFPY